MAQPAFSDMMMQRQVTLQRLTAQQVKKVNAFLQQTAAELRERLSGAELTDLSRSRLQRTLDRVTQYMKDGLSGYKSETMSDLLDIANQEADFATKALSVSVGTDFDTPSAQQIKTAALSQPLSITGADGGKLLSDFITDWSVGQIKGVSNAIRLGVAQGQTNAAIVQRIVGTAAQGYKNGLLAVTKRSADAIVHTAVQAIANSAREAVYDDNDDIVDGVIWVATLDSVTCPRCGALDEVEFDSDSGPRPPLHIFCRCATRPRLSGKFKALSAGRKRTSVGDDGAAQVSGNTSYYAWLQTQPASFQDYAIGPSRGKLLRNGGISIQQFSRLQLDKNFQPMTLEDAARVDPMAFSTAGVSP
jgi:SPP1 gp7 family putative phage head morphogenesis protein